MICRKICKHLWSLSYIMTIIRGFYFFSQSSFVSISVSPHPLALSAALLFVTIGLQIRLTTTANTNNCRSLVCYGTCTRGNRVVVEQVVTRYSLRPHSRTQWKLLLIVSKYYSDIRSHVYSNMRKLQINNWIAMIVLVATTSSPILVSHIMPNGSAEFSAPGT